MRGRVDAGSGDYRIVSAPASSRASIA